jgi:hypothetical protein
VHFNMLVAAALPATSGAEGSATCRSSIQARGAHLLCSTSETSSRRAALAGTGVSGSVSASVSTSTTCV